MSQTLTLRVPDSDAEEVRRIAKRERRSVNDVGARIVDEWLRSNRFPLVEFRTINGERTACVKGRLEIWQVIMVARGHDDDVAAAAQHLNLRPEQVASALRYYSAHPDEIEQSLSENRQGFERLKQILPQVQRVVLTDEDLASVEIGEPTQ
jgi:hypothetical protein